ncbi:MAG: hypothetical protein GXP10_10725 [Gammaproteobacteria bacterium]|nr:hypothetical protein [Gammaproteobacteria bacterium]
MMIAGSRLRIVLFLGVLLFGFSGSVLADFSDLNNAFGESSYERQQRQAQKGFEDFDAEFGEESDDVSANTEPKRAAPQEAVKPASVIVVVPVVAPEPRKRAPKIEPVLLPRQTMEKSGLTFDLKSCRQVEKTLNCGFMITSNSFDRSVTVWLSGSNGSRMLDNAGNEYSVSSIAIGSKKSENWYLSTTLVSDIPTKANLRFTNISSEASSLAVLQVQGHASRGQGKDHFDLKFRDVAIE